MGELTRESYPDDEDVLLFVGLAQDDGGCVDLGRLLGRPAGSKSRSACVVAMERGWIDGPGRVTYNGSIELERWRHA